MPPHSDGASNAVTDNNGSPSKSPHEVHPNRHDSKVSVDSVRSHQDYINTLKTPTEEEIRRISSIQEAREEENIWKRISMENPGLSDVERTKAASLIQRNYRGYRTRRQLEGLGLDPSSRWVEAIREARYRNMTTPKARVSFDRVSTGTDTKRSISRAAVADPQSFAREKWRQIGIIARRAAGDEDSDFDSDENSDLPDEQREERRKRRMDRRKERQKEAKIMDLQYFLEMVDLKHRYGSNLRVYHREWQKSSTHENFFYWLDQGEGRFIDAQGCRREQLDRERVRYLSREERLDYLVRIDKEGRLCWAKNGARIDTTEKYKDSIHGIVPITDPTPAYAAPEAEASIAMQDHNSGSSETSASSIESHSDQAEASRAKNYGTPELDRAQGMKKAKAVSASTIFNKLLRSSVKKNTWIFVADTSFRLYVGIKQSGAFQHSSFLHGSRIAAAGLIKIKDGRLDKLSPLSGHYRPHTSHFRAFVHSLKEAGADMSHVSISRSYAILVGLEAYMKTRRRGKRLVKALFHGRDMLLSPQQLKQREERELDKRESAERERRIAEIHQEDEKRDENIANLKLLRKLHIRPTTPKHAVNDGPKERIEEKPEEEDAVAPGIGNGLENAIGTRKT